MGPILGGSRTTRAGRWLSSAVLCARRRRRAPWWAWYSRRPASTQSPAARCAPGEDSSDPCAGKAAVAAVRPLFTAEADILVPRPRVFPTRRHPHGHPPTSRRAPQGCQPWGHNGGSIVGLAKPPPIAPLIVLLLDMFPPLHPSLSSVCPVSWSGGRRRRRGGTLRQLRRGGCPGRCRLRAARGARRGQPKGRGRGHHQVRPTIPPSSPL